MLKNLNLKFIGDYRQMAWIVTMKTIKIKMKEILVKH